MFDESCKEYWRVKEANKDQRSVEADNDDWEYGWKRKRQLNKRQNEKRQRHKRSGI